MTVSIEPSTASGSVQAPPSKSAAHRLLICAGLSSLDSMIHGIPYCDDILATVDCLDALGCGIELADDSAYVRGGMLASAPDGAVLNCRDSASTLRFLLPAALLSGSQIRFTGSKRLMSRPVYVYADVFLRTGARFDVQDDSITVKGKLRAGKYNVYGGISSQFISGLCMALPVLSGRSLVDVDPPFVSVPYVDMTLKIMAMFSVRAHRCGTRIKTEGSQGYTAGAYNVEGDWSAASVLDALNLFGGNVDITGLDPDSPQGDKIYKQHFSRIKKEIPVLDLSDCPDIGPVCMAAAAAFNGAVFTGTDRLRFKESDRCRAMEEELRKFGVYCETGGNRFAVKPYGFKRPNAPLYGHNDHRIVMALSVLATVTGGTITGAEVINKSFPGFFHVLRSLGVTVREQ